MYRIAILFTLLAGVNAFGQGTPGWGSKPIDQWNESDVRSILTDSPWGRVIETPGGVEPSPGGLHLYPTTTTVVTLRSALIVRYALIRKLQLKEKYDAMDAKGKADFNKKYRAILECPPCNAYYVISITSDSELFQNPVALKNREKDIWLVNEKGEKRTLAKFTRKTPADPEAIFYFPRDDENGKPLLSADSTTVSLAFKFGAQIDGSVRTLQPIDFKVADIVRDGKVIF